MFYAVKATARRLFFYFLESTAELSLSAPTPREEQLIFQLRARIGAMEPLPERTLENSTWWLDSRREIRRKVMSRDPRRFLRWGNVIMNMYPAYNEYLRTELANIKAHPEYESRWKSVIAENGFGGGIRSPLDKRTSGSAVHSAHHLLKFSEFSRMDVSDFDSIIEFGGGYGRLCEMVHKAGFKGQYTIFDLPEFSALQDYYLRSQDVSNVLCVSEMKKFFPASAGKQLFIATWSFSETPVAFRAQFEPVLARCDALLIAYNEKTYPNTPDEVDNLEYFADLRSKIGHAIYDDFPIPHMGSGNRYFFSKAL